ncbi:hypothetical protein V1264_003371 [Littorina saxatilis]|uniref:Fibrinogen C-terminal domain-containing protein n=2 Tax=Littorina saxatilis TaxID=31220 RepID=A0AAN9B8I0_9CAEN
MTSQQSQSPVPGAASYIQRKPDVLPRTCAEAKQMGQDCSAVQKLNISSQFSALEAACDEDWTVILRRHNSTVDFFRGWTDYVNGFGDLDGAYWLGLEAIYQLTSNTRHDLRVELEDWDDVRATAEYSGFSLSSASDNYTLFVQSFVGGDAGDSLTAHTGTQFSTKDRDNDRHSSGKCAHTHEGAWWYTACHSSNLCGEFKSHNPPAHGKGIQWSSWKGYHYSLKFAQMMVRPTQ